MMNAESPITPFRSLLVGFGYSGAEIHLPALERLARDHVRRSAVAAVDPAFAATGRDAPIPVFASFGDAADGAARDAVIHVCTPPATHVAAVAEAARHGFRRFIVEKPMVTTQRDLDTIERLARRHGLDILVVSNWLSSALTDALLLELGRRGRGAVAALAIRQVKPRIARSLASTTHSSVFEVELPHEFALARLLVGEALTVVDGYCGDLEWHDTRIKQMGVAEVVLRSPSVPYVLVYSDLIAPHRERSVLISWADGSRTCGFYPCSRADHYAQLMQFDRSGALIDRSFLEDNAFERFIADAYSYFDADGARPRSDAAFHAEVCALLASAQAVCTGTSAAMALGALS